MTTTAQTNDGLRSDLRRALDVLERNTGVQGLVVALEPEVKTGHRPDALIDITVEGKEHRYAVEAKPHVDRFVTVDQVKKLLNRTDEPGLLFTPYITAEMAKRCRTLDLAFLDAVGNAYIRAPGIYIYIAGEKPKQKTIPIKIKRAGATATALRVVFALLCKQELLNATYREIVKTADVAIGGMKGVLLDLEARGYIAGKQRKHNRRFLEPKRLFEEWVTNYPIILRPKLNPRRFRAENPEWWKHADLTDLPAYWGGEIATHRLTNYLKPVKCTLYIEPETNHAEPTRTLARIVAANRLRADPQGDIEILDTFWNLPPNPNHPDVVPPILAYADVMATLDPRNIEVAKLIREQYIDDALG